MIIIIIIIMKVIVLNYSSCFEDIFYISTSFCRNPMYNGRVIGLKVEQFSIHLLQPLPPLVLRPIQDGNGNREIVKCSDF